MQGMGGHWCPEGEDISTASGQICDKSGQNLSDVLAQTLPLFFASPFFAILSSFISFSPVSPPPIKYDFSHLCGNTPARPSSWDKQPQAAALEPGDAWQTPRCRHLVGGEGRGAGAPGRRVPGDAQRRDVSNTGCRLHFQDGNHFCAFEYKVKPKGPFTATRSETSQLHQHSEFINLSDPRQFVLPEFPLKSYMRAIAGF